MRARQPPSFTFTDGARPRPRYPEGRRAEAGLDEGLLPLSLSDLLYMENPYGYKKCQ
jgi:hypothetical protein